MAEKEEAHNYGGLEQDFCKLSLEKLPSSYNLRTRKTTKRCGVDKNNIHVKAINRKINGKNNEVRKTAKLGQYGSEIKEELKQELPDTDDIDYSYPPIPKSIKIEPIFNPIEESQLSIPSPGPEEEITDTQPVIETQTSGLRSWFTGGFLSYFTFPFTYPIDYMDDCKPQIDQRTLYKKDDKISTKTHPTCYFVVEKINSGKELFDLMQNCRIADSTGCKLIMVEYSWREKHLRLEQGLNILATCTNYQCKRFLEGIICARGWFPERNGYCPLDGELFNIICPKCKTQTTPDDSVGFGFYNCGFQLTYKLHKQPKYTTELQKKEKNFYFGKYRALNENFDFLQVKMSV